MQNKIALESLVQKGKSEFFKKLESVYQEAQQALQDTYNPSIGDIVRKFDKAQIREKLLKVIQDTMQTPVTMVKLQRNTIPMLYCSMASNGYAFKKRNPETPRMAMDKIAVLYDDRKGAMSEFIDIKTCPFVFKIILNVGLWMMHNEDNSPYFTPAELAAATLHEVGHVDHFIRTAYDLQNRLINASDIIEYVRSHYDPEVVRSLIKAIRESKHLDRESARMVNLVETYFSTSNSQDDPYYWEALSTLGLIIAGYESNTTVRNYADLITQTSANIYTRVNKVDSERSADEYALRNGAYADLASIMSKFDKLLGTKFKDFYEHIAGYKLGVVGQLMHSFKITFDVRLEEVANGYDPLLRRMELMTETAKHAFHRDDLSPEEQADIKSQITEAETYINEYRSGNHRKVRALLKTWKDNVGKFGRLIASPVQNRLSKDYGRLQDANRALSRNPLYYLAKK